MSYLFPNYLRKNIEFVQGKEQTLVDSSGKQYLDFTSGIGVMNLGYNNAQLNEQLIQQASLLWHIPNLYKNQLQEELAKKLARGKNYISYFCNSGAEANEAAIKLARKATGKTKIISFTNSFHGRTYGAMSATGQSTIHEGFYPLVPDFIYLPFNDFSTLEQSIDTDTAAVMLELVQGEGGVIPADKAWVKQLVDCCQSHNILVIVDEIQTGIGRTGTFYAFEQYGFEPDIVTLAKALGNGFPVGAMLAKHPLGEAFGPGSHGSTFGGNKLAMRVANYVVDEINNPKFLNDVQKKSSQLFSKLKKLESKECIQSVRGLGLMIGIEVSDSSKVTFYIDQMQHSGLLVLKAGKNVIRLLPPLTITNEELKKGLSIMYSIFEEAD